MHLKNGLFGVFFCTKKLELVITPQKNKIELALSALSKQCQRALPGLNEFRILSAKIYFVALSIIDIVK
jgi:hypothetical protein